MIIALTRRRNPPNLSLKRALFYLVLTALLGSSALAVPITYTGFTITDGKIGTQAFHNARIILTFVSDTANVQLTTIQGVAVAYNPAGTARINIVGDHLSIQATFAPNQIFISLDQVNAELDLAPSPPMVHYTRFTHWVSESGWYLELFQQAHSSNPVGKKRAFPPI